MDAFGPSANLGMMAQQFGRITGPRELSFDDR